MPLPRRHTNHARTFRTRQAGFTLVEVIAILILLGILSAVAASRFMDTGAADVRAAADTLKSHLRYAQIRAMNSNVTWGIDFAANSYTLMQNGAASATRFPGTSSGTVTLGSGLAVSSTVDPITFSQRGSPGATTATITVSKGGNSTTITVTKKTGFIP